ncbi:hypothetical protein HU200_016167 [Digitaria exilis]|uniref:Uncharacterized protein n=1 Tax=Digitaria exilis TaxID=1010633 RepID=A0A835KJ40_9POAL|nr:hypothetical protein HU200_016167 [Digitaria exilis]
MNSTSLDESKVTTIFCLKLLCNHFGRGWQNCYYCGADPKERCYETIADCRAKCPLCNPRCSPPRRLAMEGIPRVKNSTYSQIRNV